MPARLHGPRGPRASPTLRLGLSAAILIASLGPDHARAEPAIPKEAEQHYDRGVRERDAGNHATAAQEFAAAYAGMPVELKELRASILFDLVDSHRSAFTAGGRTRGREHPAAHLCAAEKSLGEFMTELERDRRGKKKSPDELKAAELRTAVQTELDRARADTPDLDCATVEYPAGEADAASPPEPAQPADQPPRPTRPKPIVPLVIAGSVTVGVGLIMVGLMAGGLVRGKRAEADGDALVDINPTRPKNDPALQEIDQRGHVGNNMAIAGGVLGAVCLGTGIALLVVGLRGKPDRRAARNLDAAPYATPQTAGLTLRWQF